MQRCEQRCHPTRVVFASDSLGARASCTNKAWHGPRVGRDFLTIGVGQTLVVIEGEDIACVHFAREPRANSNSLDEDLIVVQIQIHQSKAPM